MSQVSTTAQPATSPPLKRLVVRYPIVSFFVIAFAGAWLALLPLLLDRHGIGLLPVMLPDVVFFPLAAIAGPTLASFVMTAVTDGRTGIRQLLSRYIRWRVGIQWYMLAIFGPVLLLFISESLLLGTLSLHAFALRWSLIFTSYLPKVVLIVLVVQLFEEGGWSGFLLPRLQQKCGPLVASIILAVLWCIWHVPTFFIRSGLGSGYVPPSQVLPNLGLLLVYGIPLRIVWTWVFNNTKESILLAVLLHAAADASISLVFYQIITTSVHLSSWQNAFFGIWDFRIALIVYALIVLIATRGHLSYKRNRIAQTIETSRVAETTSTT